MSAKIDNDINNIMNYLMKKDGAVKMEPNIGYDINVPDQFLDDAWPSSPDDLLENIFSLGGEPLLEDGPIDPVNDPIDHGNHTPSDSGLSMDHSDFDMLSLSPLLNVDYDSGDGGNLLHPLPLPSPLPSPLSSLSPSPPPAYSNFQPEQIMQETTQYPVIHVMEKQHNVVKDNTNNLKRKCSVSPSNVSVPKIQKHFINRRDSTSSSASSTSSNGAPRVVICNSSPIKQQSPRKVIRVAPLQGGLSNPRSILLPVTIKDMKELKTIKIINASDLKNSASIKIAAANFLQQSKQIIRETPNNNKILYTTATYEADEQRYVMEECGSSGRSEGEADHEDEESHEEEENNGDAKQFPRLRLTPEERRLLQREGVTLPDRYPLTRGEERELKRIRRKIRNKISAQDSRRRKKEYVDGLEDRVKQCTDENQTLMKRIKALQSQNNSLSAQLKKLQTMLSGNSGTCTKTAPPATCLLVLLLSMALVVAPNLRPNTTQLNQPAQHSPVAHNTHLSSATHSHFVSSIRRALLSMQVSHPVIPLEEVIEEEVPMDDMVMGDHTYNMPGSPQSIKDLVGTGAPFYMDMPLDGDNLIKIEKIDYDSDYGGSTTADHITISSDWGGKNHIDLNIPMNNNKSFTGTRTIVVTNGEDQLAPMLR